MLEDLDQLQRIKDESSETDVLIFKYSTRCSISGMVLSRLERAWNSEDMKKVKTYFLDLIAYRDISNTIEDLFEVRHESPQVILIRNGESIYDNSHMGISYTVIQDLVKG
jgi:bacillithiol system protein YtxJ